ncbi:TPA: hypothetical protein ACMDVK_004446 [Vibrio parahaemolyticus]|uniref:hypothetical protein n=1 Tax=Vibrio parahaemolyticus TaxID=670 RepID=UPI0004A3BB4F|nr:hypothetical protein [Vibrio parahaemolyticus]MCC3817966.1 hypothetical protein [Vibrio parahaemolyticus]MCC3854640.1 hypothetical protein [Vibrio parahaemolyticus]
MAVYSKKHELLDLACQLTETEYNKETPDITFTVTPATPEHILDTDKWPDVSHLKSGYGNMDWGRIYRRQACKSKRFLCAIHTKHDSALIGLFAGRVSPDNHDGSKVSIDYIERNATYPLGKGHVMAIAVKLAYILADALEYCIVRVNNPAKGLIDKYKGEMPNATHVQASKYHSYLEAPVSTNFP